MKKRLTSLALTLALLCTLVLPASAHDMGKPGQATKISAGTWYSGYVDENGSLWMWGENLYGELGNGTSNQNYLESNPDGYRIMDNVVCVSTADSGDDMEVFTAAIRADGSLWMWGANSYGQLGNGGGGNTAGEVMGCEICQTVPLKIMDDVAFVDCGAVSTAAIKTDGSLWMWGGLYSKEVLTSQFTPIKIMDDVIAVSCGLGCSAAIKSDGSLWTWGASGLTGNGYQGNLTSDSVLLQTIPMKIMDDVVAVSCGTTHAAAVKTDGSLWVWGSNGYDQLGLDGSTDETIPGINYPFKSVPTKVMDDVSSVCCGYGCTAAIKTDGSLWTWGWNDDGQLGNGGIGNSKATGSWGGLTQSTPLKVMDNVSAVSCSMSHMIAAQNDGTLWTWGHNIGGTAYSRIGEDRYNTILRVPAQVTIGTQEAVPTSVKFSDVAADAFYADAVRWAVDRGITSGTSSTTFSPNSTCTVAQILTFLYRANGSPQINISNPFVDISSSNYYYNAALWAYQKGLVSGSVFNPTAPCTRSMVVTYLWKLAGSPVTSVSCFAPYTISGKIDNGWSEGEGGWEPKLGDCTVNFSAAIAKNMDVTLYSDLMISDNGYNWRYEKNNNGWTDNVTVVAVCPGSKINIDIDYYEFGFDKEVLNCTNCFLDRDGTLRYIWMDDEHDDTFFYEDFLNYYDEDFSGHYGTDIQTRFAGSVIHVGDDYHEYLILYADVAAAAGLLDGTVNSVGFSDVLSSTSYAQAVAWAVDKGITSGTSKTTFSPDGVCTRGQIVTFLYRAFGK